MVPCVARAALPLSILLALSLAASPRAANGPAPPEWVGIYEIQGRAGLLWIKDPGVQRTLIYRRAAAEPEQLLVGETDGNRFTDGSVLPGVTYRYRLLAVGADGRQSPPSAEAVFALRAVRTEITRPPAIEGYVTNERGVGLKWEHLDPSLVVAYNIYRAVLPDGSEELIASSRESFYTDYRAEPGVRYRYRVSAIDASFKETQMSAPLEVFFQRRDVERVEREPTYRRTPRRSSLLRTLPGGGSGKGRPFLSPTDAALSGSTLFVSDSGNGVIQVFSKGGDYRYEFPVPPADDQPKSVPLGLEVDREGRLLCSDAYSGRVLTFLGNGVLTKVVNVPRRKPRAPADPQEKKEPQDIPGLLDLALTRDGHLLVVDNGNQRVVRFDTEGAFEGFFGRPGAAPGELMYPGFCAVDPQGRLMVSEALGGRISIFSQEGLFVKSFGRYARSVGCLARPKGIAVDARGRIWVADSWLCQVQAFDEQGGFLFTLADEQGRALDLGAPNGIVVEADNTIYIVEKLAHRVQMRRILYD